VVGVVLLVTRSGFVVVDVRQSVMCVKADCDHD